MNGQQSDQSEFAPHPLDKRCLHFPRPFAIIQPQTQDSYIGNTTASHAVKAGSTPVSCSKKEGTHWGAFFFGLEKGVEPI